MRIPRPSKRPWIAVAAVLAATVILLTAFHYGNATANTGPPDPPANPLAHLIVPDNEEPRVRISWDASRIPVSGYTIARTDGQQFQAGSSATTFSDHSVEPGTTYSYSVVANSTQGSSSSSTSAAASVPDAPSQPGDLTGSVDDVPAENETATVNLAWLASTVPVAIQCETSYPLDGYTVLRSDGNQEVEVGAPDGNTPSITDGTAAFGTTYTYRVLARNAIGTSPAAETTVVVPARPVETPTGLAAFMTDPFDGAVSLSWQAPLTGPVIAGYQIIRNGASIADNVSEAPYRDDSVQVGVHYSYTIRARSADNISDPSEPATIEAPAPPNDLTATTGEETIEIRWSAPATGNFGQYRVERQGQDSQWATLTDTSAAGHSDDTAQFNIPYVYRVQHRNQHGGSVWIESNAVTLLAKPGQPTDLTATVEGTDNILTWTAPVNSVVDGYEAQRHTDDGEWQVLAADVTNTSHRHRNAAADVNHQYRVRAYNDTGDGPWSETAAAMRITTPDMPGSLSAAVEGNDIVISWTRPATVHLTGYALHITNSADDNASTEIIAAGVTSHRMINAAADVSYSFKIRAQNDGGSSAWTEVVDATRIVPPAAPERISAETGDNDITVTWSSSNARFVDGYQLRHGEADAAETQTVDLAAATTSYIHTAPDEGTVYHYEVRAHNSAGYGPWSTSVDAFRLNAPSAPTGVAAVVSGNMIIVSWTQPETGVVSSYKVEHGIAGESDVIVESVDGTTTEFVHSAPQGDTEYSYRVRASNGTGNSPWSDSVGAMWVLPPNPPTDVATTQLENDITVSWTAPANGIIGGYQVDRRQVGTEDWSRNEVAATTTSDTHVQPTPGATYEYRIRTVNVSGYSTWTQPVTAVWYLDAAPPPNILIRNFGATRLRVQWNPSQTSAVTGYEVRHRIDGGEWVHATTKRFFHFTSWSTEQTWHEYSVRSLINDVTGDWSPVQRIIITRPGRVENLSLNHEGANGIRLRWDPPSNGQPALYIMQVKDGNSRWRNSGAAAGHKTNYRHESQPWGSTYRYRVIAENHVRITGPAAATYNYTMPSEPGRQPQGLPTGLEAHVIDGETVNLSWQAPDWQPNRIVGYRIYRKLASDTRPMGESFSDHVLVRNSGSAATQYSDHTAQAGLLYEYAVSPFWRNVNDSQPYISNHRAYGQTW